MFITIEVVETDECRRMIEKALKGCCIIENGLALIAVDLDVFKYAVGGYIVVPRKGSFYYLSKNSFESDYKRHWFFKLFEYFC